MDTRQARTPCLRDRDAKRVITSSIGHSRRISRSGMGDTMKVSASGITGSYERERDWHKKYEKSASHA